jgi:hypothetical protein
MIDERKIIKEWLEKVEIFSDKKQKLFNAFKDEFGFDANIDDYWSVSEDIYGIVHKMTIPKGLSENFCEVYFSIDTPGRMPETYWYCMPSEKGVALKKQSKEYSYEVLFRKRGK